MCQCAHVVKYVAMRARGKGGELPENKKNINLGFRVTAGRQEDLKVRSARRKQSIQQMIEQGLDLLFADTAPPGQPHYETQNLPLHDKLERILNSGDAKIIEAVVPNIEVFYERLRPGARKREGGKS
jgi:hypothetical protein